jgi:hypothetical protein
LRPWSEVARLWNERENASITEKYAKEIGRQALLKLKDRLESMGTTFEDLSR